MANIATVQIRLELEPGAPWPADVDVIGALLWYHGWSYHVPLVLTRVPHAIEVQYGERWSPGAGPLKLWARVHAASRRLWVRWYDDGGDDDVIYDLAGPVEAAGDGDDHDDLDDDGDVLDALQARTTPRPCRYRCDRVVLDGGARALDVDATYVTGNDRCSLLEGPRLATPTSPARESGGFVSRFLSGVSDAEVEGWRATAHTIDLMWRDRLVHRSRRDARGVWVAHALDHWDNCADEAYLRDATRGR